MADSSVLDTEESVLSRSLARLGELLEKDAVEEARALVQELLVRWPDSERVRRWARVLEPPRSWRERRPRERALDRERDWLREHAHEHPGCTRD